MVTRDQILDRLLRSAAGQQIAANIDQERQAERQALARELTLLRQSEAREGPKRRATVEAAREALDRARAALKAVEADVRRAESAAFAASHSATTSIERIERQLRATASPAIGDFLRELDRLETGVLGRPDPSTGLPLGGNRSREATGKLVGAVMTSRNAALARIRAARQAAEALKLEPLADEDLAKRLAALRRDLKVRED